MTTDDGGARPTIALAMLDGLLEHAFSADHLDRLRSVGDLLDERPLTDFADDRSARLLAQADVLVGHWGCPTLTAEAVRRAPRLRLFAYAAGTVKWQVTDAVWEREVVVTSAAAANAVPVAEYTLAMVLLAGKGVLLAREAQRDPDVRVPLDPMRIGNAGKRIGLVGASHVGRLVIELLAPHDLQVAVYDPYLTSEDAERLGVHLVEDLDELCAGVDVLSIHAPDVEATRGMIGAEQLARLPDGATLINTARPALVDTAALEAELRSGRIAAVLDVTDPEPMPPGHPLLSLPNVFVTPHVAGAAGNELVRLAELAVTEVERFAAGHPPLYPVTAADLDRIA
jgi:phosphoglycerate dehydrogenase-like enzyme